MSLMFLNPFDRSGLGIYSKTAKSIVERMPVLAKQRKQLGNSNRVCMTEQDQQFEGVEETIETTNVKSNRVMVTAKKQNLKALQPFTKSLSRQQRAFAQTGKQRYPAVGAYHPKQILKQPKYVWNLLNVYQRSLSNKKGALQRRQKVNELIKSKSINKKKPIVTQNPQNEQNQIYNQQQDGEENIWKQMVTTDDIKYDKFRFKNQYPFVDMNRMVGRQSTHLKSQQTYYQTVQSQQGGTFLTNQIRNTSPARGTIQFSKQLSRQKVSGLLKPNSHLVYDCNYQLVSSNNKIGPKFSKMVNRQGKSIQTQINDQQYPDYSQIWLHRNKKSLPNLQLIMQRKMNKQKLGRKKTTTT